MGTVLIEKFVKMNKFIIRALFSFAHSHNQIAPPLRVAISGFHMWNKSNLTEENANMATYREMLSRPTLSLEEIWEKFLDLEIEKGSELKQAAALLQEYDCTPETKVGLMKKVQVEVLKWKPKD